MTVAARPEPGPPRPYSFPRFARHRLANGLEVIVAPVHKLPMVTVTMICDAGASSEALDQAGVAQLTARALLEGTRGSPGAELTDRFERLGANIDAGADWDASIVSLTVLTERFDAAMALFGEVLLEPDFTDRAVERLRAERLSELLQLRTEPRGLADEMFARVLYRPESRYARPQDGGEETVSMLSVADLRAFHRDRYRPGSAALVIVGDVDVEGAVAMAERRFAGWADGVAARVEVSDQPAHTERATHIVAKSDAAQSELRIGHVGLPRSHPEYFPVLVMNALLGGLFSSRINLNLRERNGYTYGAFSGYEWRRGSGPFLISTAVASDVTAAAAREVLAEVERMQAEAVTEEELTLATSYLAGVFPIRYETTGAIARALAAMRVHRLPEDYFDTYRERVLSITPADVLRAARDHVHPQQFQLLVVGDPAAVRTPLAELEIGRLIIHEVEAMANSRGDDSRAREDS